MNMTSLSFAENHAATAFAMWTATTASAADDFGLLKKSTLDKDVALSCSTISGKQSHLSLSCKWLASLS